MKRTRFIGAFLAAVIPLSGGLQAGEDDTYQSSKEVVVAEPVEDPWGFGLSVYGLLPWADLTLSGGTGIHLDLENVWDALNMTAQFEAGVRKGKWGISADVIYVDLDCYGELGQGDTDLIAQAFAAGSMGGAGVWAALLPKLRGRASSWC